MKNKTIWYVIPILMCLAVLTSYRALVSRATDTTPPVIHMEGELTVSILDGQEALLQGVTATDDTDGDVSGSIVMQSVKLLDRSGTVLVTYAAFDSAGNVAKAQRQVQYRDYESPRFHLSGPLLFPEKGTFNILDLIQAEDPIRGDISRWIRTTVLSGTTLTTPGVHQVLFQVTSSMGETVKLELPVEVYPAGLYAAKLTLTDYLVYLPIGCYFDPNTYLESFTLSGNTTELSTLPAGYAVSIAGQVDTNTPGVYTLGYTVTYTQDNPLTPGTSQTFSGYSKLVVVVEG